jgi:DMSO/TMAO reductase YedYZ molybdopterin-dependent catalytic subunit
MKCFCLSEALSVTLRFEAPLFNNIGLTGLMSLFRSLHLEETSGAEKSRPWPQQFREPLPQGDLSKFTLKLQVSGQTVKTLDMKQMAILPSFMENRRIASQSGWMYYGSWKGFSMQTLLNQIPNAEQAQWIEIKTLTGKKFVTDKASLIQYRLLKEADNEALTPDYGGPLMLHHFDHYIEYAVCHVASINLLEAADSHQLEHPASRYGFALENARIQPGDYYAIHQQRITHL